jgi:DNA-binding MurR/RpiR family transcriptional regulator
MPDPFGATTGTPARSVRQAVARRYQQLTRAEQQVADAVLQQPRRVVDLPIYDLARELGVAPAVISRFSRATGLGGFRALRLALAEELGADRAATPASDGPPSDDPRWEVARRAMQADLAALQHTIACLDPTALAAAAVRLAHARRVIAAGNDASGVVARRLATMLARRGWRARAEVAPNDTTWTNDVDVQDVVIIVSHRGQLLGPGAALLAALPIVRQHGAQILALTNVPDAPVARAADFVLATCLPGDTSDDAYVFDPVFLVQLVVVRALVAAAIAARTAGAGDGGGA